MVKAKASYIEERFPGEYGPWESATGPVNLTHTADQHPYEGDPNDWSTVERIGSRATCSICRVIFREDGTWRSEVPARRTPELAERENRPTHRAPAAARTTYPASEAQANFLDSLWRDREHSDLIDAVLDAAKADKKAASNLITLLKDRPFAKKATAPTSGRITEDGMYRRAADGVVFKVQKAVHGSGNLYAKQLVIDTEVVNEGRFEYAAGAIKTLTPADKMTLEQAKEFGRLYGICCKCGATLTDESSIEDGIGPVCGSKGW